MNDKKIRFAVIGLGNIAQMAVLPAFAHATEGTELVALVSSDAEKLQKLSKTYAVKHTGSYDDLERIFEAAKVDAAYIALPNHLHREYTERCARAGVHVLLEKPMATSVEDCDAMIRACDQHHVKLMIAYRLHFESANLHAIELAKSGALGEIKSFESTFTQQVRDGDIRTKDDLGGGALFDMGIYCVNAARYLMQEEPEEVMAFQTIKDDDRFHGVDESTTAILRFSGGRLAHFFTSQGSADVDEYRLVGTKGNLLVQPAYTYFGELAHHVTIGEQTKTKTYKKTDQFAPELLHFAACIRDDIEPEPSGEEGLADVRVMVALIESAKTGKAVRLPPFDRRQRPDVGLEMRKPPVSKKPELVNAPSPSK